MTVPPAVLVGLALVGIALLAIAAWAIGSWVESRRHGRLMAVDGGPSGRTTLRSARWRISGTPDELRRHRDGSVIPVEWKRRPTPARGPLPSHVVQVWAYCLLVQETWGTAPRYGILRYGDGGEFEIPWNRVAEEELLRVRRAVARPYGGEASPSVGKCGRCRYRPGCDRRAA